MIGKTRRQADLEFKDLDSLITTFTVRVKPIYWLQFEGSAGFGDIDEGIATDQTRVGGAVVLESDIEASGKLTTYEARSYIRLFPWEEHSGSYLDGFVGYQYHEERILFGDARQRIPVDGKTYPIDFDYECEFHSVPIGLKGNLVLNENIRPWLYSVSLKGLVASGMTWRDDNEGYLVMGELGITYKPVKYFSIGAGYQLQRYEGIGGKDEIYDDRMGKFEADVEEVKLIRHGPYFLISAQF